MKIFIIKNNKGYTILETLFYISLFAILSVVVINSLVVMTTSFRETRIQRNLSQGASIMEKMSRELRESYSITSVGTGTIKFVAPGSGGALTKTVDYVLSSANIRLLNNNTFVANLNSSEVSITSLSFTQITTTLGVAVKIAMTLTNTNDPSGRSADFYDTVILRGAY